MPNKKPEEHQHREETCQNIGNVKYRYLYRYLVLPTSLRRAQHTRQLPFLKLVSNGGTRTVPGTDFIIRGTEWPHANEK
jgi:hypothetical protein